MSQKQLETSDPIAQDGHPSGVERRRPRRLNADPSLIPLLRQPTEFSELGDEQFMASDDSDRLSAARGIIVGCLLAVPLWIILGAVTYALLK